MQDFEENHNAKEKLKIYKQEQGGTSRDKKCIIKIKIFTR